MSVRIYTSPGSIIFPRPPVLRQYVPGKVSRQVRYTRSLSTPLDLEKEFTYSPWEGSRRDFTSSLLESGRRDFTIPAVESRRRFLINQSLSKPSETPISSSESTRRNIIDRLWETKPIPLSESKRRNFLPSLLETKERERAIPYLETRRRNITSDHLDNNRRDFANSLLETKRKDLANNHLESSPKSSTESCSENKRRDLANNHLENNRKDSSNSHLRNKVSDFGSNDLETRSRTLIESVRPIRWWNKEKNLCTPDDLLEIIREPTGHYELPTDPCNEVYPGILLSDGPTALCTAMLKRMGVSHVLNAAQGKERPGQVNTSSSFYSHSRIRYLGVEAFDHIAFRLYPYFEEASDFMQEALDSGGKVLVHCRAGISRSATLVCAFLMMKRHQSAQEAIRTVRKNRAIIPNDGFLQQLCDLNERLHKTRGP